MKQVLQAETTLVIKGLVLYGYHGALEQEKILGGKYEIDLFFTYNAHIAASTDDLTKAVNYQNVVALIVRLWEQTSWNLLECMASGLLKAVTTEFPTLRHATIYIRKYSVPLGVPLDYVEVRQSITSDDIIPD